MSRGSADLADTADTAAVAGALPGREIVEAALAAGHSALDESSGKALFAAYGIPVTPGRVVESEEAAVQVAGELGYPVVMKGLSREVLHKTDAGLVVLDVDDEEAVRSAFHVLERRGEGRLDGTLVEKMLPRGREFVVGLILSLIHI